MPHPLPDRAPGATSRLAVLDILRGITILWVALWHFHVDTRGLAGPDLGAAACLAAAGRGAWIEALSVATRAVIALPGVRLDVFLFVSGVVLTLGRPLPAPVFYGRRARAVLPNYWLGSLVAAALLLCLAAFRAWTRGTPFGPELHDGARLALVPYRFEWLDLVRSLSLVGRFTGTRAMQVVAPSLWYVALIAQLYLVFPLLRAVLARVGPWRFVAGCAALTWGARALAFALGPLPGFDLDATVACFLPFRLLAPALGMAAAGLFGSRQGMSRRTRTAPWWLLPVSVLLVPVSVWLGSHRSAPGSLASVFGPTVPLVLALPGLLAIAAGCARLSLAGTVLSWAGRHSLSLLVVQDFLRFGVGTAMVLDGSLARYTWWLMPVYAGAALLMTQAWHPLPTALAARLAPRPAPIVTSRSEDLAGCGRPQRPAASAPRPAAGSRSRGDSRGGTPSGDLASPRDATGVGAARDAWP